MTFLLDQDTPNDVTYVGHKVVALVRFCQLTLPTKPFSRLRARTAG